MNRMLSVALFLSIAAAAVHGQPARTHTNFASDFQTVPVMANLPGIGAVFQSYVAILNPTSTSCVVTARFFDASGTQTQASIPLGAGEAKTYENFVDADTVRLGNARSSDDARSLHAFVFGGIVEHDVERELERTRVFAADDFGEFGQGRGAHFTSSIVIGKISHGSASGIRW